MSPKRKNRPQPDKGTQAGVSPVRAHCDFCPKGMVEITPENWKERTCASCKQAGAPSSMSPTYEKELEKWLKEQRKARGSTATSPLKIGSGRLVKKARSTKRAARSAKKLPVGAAQ